jgi:hypothetical protein
MVTPVPSMVTAAFRDRILPEWRERRKAA